MVMRAHRRRLGVVAVLCSTGSFVALGDDGRLAGPAVGLTAGTLGAGVEVSYPLSSFFVVRANATGVKFDFDKSQSDNAFALSVRSLGGSAILDVHPFAGGFRLSAGGNFGERKISGDASAKANYTIGDHSYSGGAVGKLHADLDVAKVSPYFGIGYDASHLSSGFHLGIEVGALYIGKSSVKLSTDGSVPGLAADLAKEEQKLNDTIGKFGFYPVAAISAKYAF